ncbi:hypothetical protein NADFUDRAFT_46468 [Nadsonia fulvescens var. elongata DSM 6958]|uniref:Large ribosomal subunit protein bL34m n=1 Tax=Nadsonia fulvescens var. elongata DSM 6958 TaxID=857566 RepID=A0A1E3PKJ5_9ASCO|nr:hypothetical protein NADFUDRAFT_46468 [Nadsonia fulvescens var. elongata DSM 6958]
MFNHLSVGLRTVPASSRFLMGSRAFSYVPRSALTAFRAATPSTLNSSLAGRESTANIAMGSPLLAVPTMGLMSSLAGALQVRWKSRGHTFQPNTLKRKRKFGFLAKMRAKLGRVIISRRRAKGRWYLSH